MRVFLVLCALFLSSSFAFADCKQVVRGDGGAWQCETPFPPAPPPAPIKCWHINQVLMCNGDLNDSKPANCGWKSGKYVCW